jgi:hypothetical protein
MQRMALTEGESAPEVYIILRVYNLGREEVGVHVFLDPENWRRKKNLRFSTTYSVEPTRI